MSINHSRAMTSYWSTVAMEKEFPLSVSRLKAIAAAVKRRWSYAHSKNFYRDLDNFSMAVTHDTMLKHPFY